MVKVSLDITVITGYPAHSRNTLDCLGGKPQSQKQLWNNSGIHWRKMKCMRVELILTLMCSRYMIDRRNKLITSPGTFASEERSWLKWCSEMH